MRRRQAACIVASHSAIVKSRTVLFSGIMKGPRSHHIHRRANAMFSLISESLILGEYEHTHIYVCKLWWYQ